LIERQPVQQDARSRTLRLAAFAGIAVVGCLADLWTKHAVFDWRGPPRADNIWWLWTDFVGIETSLNPGALFGLGAGYSWLFATLSIVALVGILGWVLLGHVLEDSILLVSLGLITGGILGNLYDRLGLWRVEGLGPEPIYQVRDWILLQAGSRDLRWPNFNIADSMLVIGAGLLMWHALVHQPGEPKADDAGGKPS